MRSEFYGKGKVQIAFQGEAALLRIDAATTQTRRIKGLVADFLRKEVAHVRAGFQPFEVRIWTSEAEPGRNHDVDNVAKAVLDALNGVFWRDDRQVVRLISEKFQGERGRIAVLVRPLRKALDPVDLDLGLFDL
ncbi:MAG: RusA family crossover junction endodeoxyribonuclease [Pseudomonadota bacterium]